MKIEKNVQEVNDYDIIVAGGGVAGVAAAVSASRMGKSVLLIEKTIGLGGLATTGLINLFVPMCNGRGVQIIKGMAEELLRLSIKYGYDTIPKSWQNKETDKDVPERYVTRFSAPIFTLALTEFVKNEGIDILFDTVITEPVMENKICKGLIVENKTGCQFYGAKMVIDTTGDADILYRAGVPTVQGKNFHTYLTHGVNIESCKKAYEEEDMAYLEGYKYCGGTASLYGGGQPEGKKERLGTNVQDITEYVIENHIECLDKIKNDDRKKRTIVTLPTMPQFRETRHIDGNYTLTTDDAYKHFDDSVAAICDFDRRDYLYEVSFGTMVKDGFPNLITAGRSASAQGYAWDVLRVIPPAILTGQAAGVACAQAIDDSNDICNIDIKKLQGVLESQDVMIHFDDSLIPDKEASDTKATVDGHF